MGDQVIKYLGGIIQGHIRRSDFSFRYGGEEFIVMLVNTELENAMRVAELIRQKVEATSFSIKDKSFFITVTIGVAEYIDGETAEVFVERADKKLYEGKRTGKNKVES